MGVSLTIGWWGLSHSQIVNGETRNTFDKQLQCRSLTCRGRRIRIEQLLWDTDGDAEEKGEKEETEINKFEPQFWP